MDGLALNELEKNNILEKYILLYFLNNLFKKNLNLKNISIILPGAIWTSKWCLTPFLSEHHQSPPSSI